jgi:hypothetical protein
MALPSKDIVPYSTFPFGALSWRCRELKILNFKLGHYNHYKGNALDGQHYLAFFRQSLQAKYLVQALIPNKLLKRCQPPRYED